MRIFKKIEKKFRVCYQRSKFCMGSLWDFLVKFATPCFWHVSSKFRVWFLHNWFVFKTIVKEKIEIPWTNFETASVIWKSFHLVQCIYQNSQNRSLSVNKKVSVPWYSSGHRYKSIQCRASLALAQRSLKDTSYCCMKYRPRLKGYFDQSAHCWSMFTAMPCNGYLPFEGFCYFSLF